MHSMAGTNFKHRTRDQIRPLTRSPMAPCAAGQLISTRTCAAGCGTGVRVAADRLRWHAAALLHPTTPQPPPLWHTLSRPAHRLHDGLEIIHVLAVERAGVKHTDRGQGGAGGEAGGTAGDRSARASAGPVRLLTMRMTVCKLAFCLHALPAGQLCLSTPIAPGVPRAKQVDQAVRLGHRLLEVGRAVHGQHRALRGWGALQLREIVVA